MPEQQPTTNLDLGVDGHVHTRLCNHAVGEMEEYVTAAIAKGLRTIIFLEHLETGITGAERIWLTREDFDHYQREGARLKDKYRDAITIKLGVEVGFNPDAISPIKDTLREFPWDHIGLSYHFLRNGERHVNMVSSRRENIATLVSMGPDKVLTAYFNGLQQGVEELPVNVLCHLDAVLRHYPDLQFQDEHWQQIEQLLDTLAEKDTALEINTSGFPLRGAPFPAQHILGAAIKRNISFIAGSDAHSPEQVGRFFDELPAILLAAT